LLKAGYQVFPGEKEILMSEDYEIIDLSRPMYTNPICPAAFKAFPGVYLEHKQTFRLPGHLEPEQHYRDE
jgi:hypothetical protein